MADDRRIVISSDPGTSPDDLARRSFSTSFRGFDPGEVRAFLGRLGQEIASLPIDIVGVGDDLTLARQAATFKATKKMAYADCFAAALAKIKNSELLTGDPEFKQVEKEVKIGWLK